MSTIKVLVTGAAGQIGYSLIFLIARGEMFGKDQKIILHLLDIPPAEKVLNGVVMELDDGAFPLLENVVATTSVETAFTDIDYAVLVGAFPRRKGMERKDLLEKNAAIFKEQGEALNTLAKKSVKVLVVGNPANTNAKIAMHYAPSLDKKNFSALTRLDHNRSLNQIAKKVNEPLTSITNVIIWGNHSATQYPDVSNVKVNDKALADHPSYDETFFQNDFIKTVQTRGAAIIDARNASSAASAAKAIVDHIHDWALGTNGSIVSMAVSSDGSYNVPEGLLFSFPVKCEGGNYTIVKDLPISEFSQGKLDVTTKELQDEWNTAKEFLKA